MQDAESILVIILAVVLTIFLIVAIAIGIITIKLMRSLRNVVDKAESVVDTASEAAEILRNQSGKLALFRLISSIVSTVNKKDEKGK